MSFVPILLGLVIMFGLLAAIAVMAWDTGREAITAERESKAPADALAPEPEATARDVVEDA
jgi:hypothetical protein